MKTQVIKSLILLLILATCITVPVFSQNQEQLFQKALMKEEGEGALQEAIDIYTKIVENSSAERTLRANAQLQIGFCYEKLGKKQASEAYNKVIKKFADQQKTAEVAKTRLQILATQNIQKELTPNKSLITQIPLDIGEESSSFGWQAIDFSLDGKKIVFRDAITREKSVSKSELFIAGASGVPVNLLLDSFSYSSVYNPRFSPNGKYITFLGVTDEGEGVPDKGAIYAVSVDGGKPWQISKKFKKLEQFGHLWHPDGKHIVVLNRKKGLVTYNLAGETTKTITWNYGWDRPRLSGFSPDGKWISYFTHEGWHKSQCWLVSISGDKNVRLTQNEGFDGYGTWSAKDYSFYFVSDRFGDCNIFKIKIDPETGEKIGDTKQITFHNKADVFSPAIINDNSTLVYGLQKKSQQILIPENENFKNFEIIALGTSPVLSPDGATVYFVRTEKSNPGIFSIPRKGGATKKLTDLIPTDSYFSYNYFTLSPDGSIITFLTKNDDNNAELCFLSTDGGKLHNAITIETNQIVGRDPSLDIVPTWSPDSKKVSIGYSNTVYTIPVWGNIKEKLSDIKGWEQYSTKWSPDGKYIAGFVDDNDIGNLNVVIVSTQTGEIKKLTTDEEKEYKENLEWHPDGDKLTYFIYYNGEDGLNTEPDDGDQIRIAYVDGSPTAEMIDQPDVWDYTGVWDPTGSNYYFEGWRAEAQQWQLNKFNVASKEFILLPFIITDHELPSFSKDGKLIVIRKAITENQLWMMEGVE